MREWRYSFKILNLGTRWWIVVSFMPLLLYHRGNTSLPPLYWRLGGTQSRSERYGEEIYLLAVPAIEPQFFCRPARCYTD
jgi:hypothetical protein